MLENLAKILRYHLTILADKPFTKSLLLAPGFLLINICLNNDDDFGNTDQCWYYRQACSSRTNGWH